VTTPANALRDAIDELVPPIRTMGDALELLGGNTADNRRRLAQLMSGVPASDRSSKPYRAARRKVERYLQGTRGGKRPDLGGVRRALMTPARARAVAQMGDEGIVVVYLDAEVTISRDTRMRTVPDVFIDGDTLNATGFVRAAGAGRIGADAAQAFAQAWGVAYGMGWGATWDDVDELTLRWP
jgi:hypothetical protein